MSGETEDQRLDPYADHPLVNAFRKSLDVRAELASSPTWRMILEKCAEHEKEWLDRLVEANPYDEGEVMRCRLEVLVARTVPAFIDQTIIEGENAALQLSEQDAPDEDSAS